jgi:6-hydroxymethylpterin diphosphokinase MptE-like
VIKQINSHCVVNDEGCERNLKATLARSPNFVLISPERTDHLAVVAAGPSVTDYLDEIKTFKEIWAINGAYDYLLDCGILPDGFLGTDPLPGLAAYLGNPQKETTFYLSALCDPSVFDALKDYNVQVWFPRTDINKLEYGLPPNTEIITGGTTALTRAPFLARCLGFRTVTLYGADSSYDSKRRMRYVYKDGTYPEDSQAQIQSVMCDGKGPFYTETPLQMQVSQLGVLVHFQTWGVKLNVRCGGLMEAYLQAPMEWDSGEDVDRFYEDPLPSEVPAGEVAVQPS